MESGSAEAFNIRGLKRLLDGAFDEAIADFNRALALEPNYPLALVSRGNAFSRKGETARAAADFDQAIALAPDCADAYVARGYLRCEHGQYHGAIEDFGRALVLDGRNTSALSGRGMANSCTGEYKRAIEDYSAAIAQRPTCAEFFIFRGDAHAQLDELAVAIMDYNRAISLQPRLAGAYAGRAIACYKTKDFARAVEDAEQALHYDPSLTAVKRILQSAKHARTIEAVRVHAHSVEKTKPDAPDTSGDTSGPSPQILKQFEAFAAPLIGMPVSHIWQGHGSSLFLEFGSLRPRKRHDGSAANPGGEMSLMIQWSWRIEGRRSILAGSWSEERKWPRAWALLRGATVREAKLFGRIAELEIVLSNGARLLSFMTAEGSPEWTLFDRRDGIVRSLHWLRGALRVETSLKE